MGAGQHAGAEQYDPSSRYPVNVIIPRHERCMSAEAHAQLFIPQACLKEQVDNLKPILFFKQMQPLELDYQWFHKGRDRLVLLRLLS